MFYLNWLLYQYFFLENEICLVVLKWKLKINSCQVMLLHKCYLSAFVFIHKFMYLVYVILNVELP